jgi:hypothetical protein
MPIIHIQSRSLRVGSRPKVTQQARGHGGPCQEQVATVLESSLVIEAGGHSVRSDIKSGWMTG